MICREGNREEEFGRKDDEENEEKDAKASINLKFDTISLCGVYKEEDIH